MSSINTCGEDDWKMKNTKFYTMCKNILRDGNYVLLKMIGKRVMKLAISSLSDKSSHRAFMTRE